MLKRQHNIMFCYVNFTVNKMGDCESIQSFANHNWAVVLSLCLIYDSEILQTEDPPKRKNKFIGVEQIQWTWNELTLSSSGFNNNTTLIDNK